MRYLTAMLVFYFVCVYPHVQAGQHRMFDGEWVQVPENVVEACDAKADVTAFTYGERDTYTQEEMMTILANNWRDNWAHLKHATYVDMQRIVRDAYRTDKKGKYNRPCCNTEIELAWAYLETDSCMKHLHF